MKTIRHQLLFWLSGGVLLYMFIGGAALFMKVSTEAHELYDDQLLQIARSLPIPFLANTGEFTTNKFHENILLQAWDPQGALIYTSNPQIAMTADPRQGFQTIEFDHQVWRIYALHQRNFTVQTAQPMVERDILVGEIALRCLVPFLLLMPILIATIWWAVRRGLAPLNLLASTVNKRSPNDLTLLPLAGLSPEMKPLCESLNDLLTKLAQASKLQKAFVADAAHELRTPLTALKLQLQLAEMAETETQRMAELDKLHQRLDRTSHLVQQLLTLARNEPGNVQRAPEPCDLMALAQQAVIDHYPVAANKNIDLGLSGELSSSRINAHPDELTLLINNLLDNAIRYTPVDGKIDVRLSGAEGKVIFRIADNGPGIPPAEYARVFDRFYRCEQNQIWGSGLGLSIVKSIADNHGAEIDLSPTHQESGLTVTVIFDILNTTAMKP